MFTLISMLILIMFTIVFAITSTSNSDDICINGLYPSLYWGLTKFNTFTSYPWAFKYPAVLSYNSPLGSVNTYEPSNWYALGIEYDADLPEPEPPTTNTFTFPLLSTGK